MNADRVLALYDRAADAPSPFANSRLRRLHPRIHGTVDHIDVSLTTGTEARNSLLDALP